MVAASRAAGWAALALLALSILLSLSRSWGLTLDFANFFDAGRKALSGEFADLYDPFAPIAGRAPLGHMTFYSAPITSYLYAPMATLEPRTAQFLFKLTGTAALAAALLLLGRWLRRLAGRGERDRAAFFALLSCAIVLYQPFWTIYRVGGQTTPFVVLMFVLALLALGRGRSAAAACLYVGAVMIKPVFAPAAILIFVLSDTRFRLTALLLGAAAAAASLAMFGLDLHLEFLRLLKDETRKLLIPTLNSAPFSFIEPWFVEPGAYLSGSDAPPLLRHFETLLRLATAVALLAGLRALLRRGPPPSARAYAIWCAGLILSLILSPVVWAHYLAMLFPAIAALVALRRHLPVAAHVVLAAIVVLAFFQNRFVVVQIEQLLGAPATPALAAIGLLKSLPLLGFLAMLWFWRRDIAGAMQDRLWEDLWPDRSRH